MKYVFTYILLVFYFQGSSQTATGPDSFAETITSSDLQKHLNIIASAEMEGRETATQGQRKAAAYIEEQFRQIGLQPGWNINYQQFFPVYQDSLVRAALSINGMPLKQDTDYVVSNNSSFNVSFVASEVLFVGYGLSDSVRDDYKDVNARGKIVMVYPGAPPTIVKGKKQEDGCRIIIPCRMRPKETAP